METLKRSLNYELPQELHFDKYAQHILENSKTPSFTDTTTIALNSSPSITTFDKVDAPYTTSDFFKNLGASFIHSIQLQSLPKTQPSDTSVNLQQLTPSISSATAAALSSNMELSFPNQLIMDSQNYNTAMDELQKQLEYDKFMNEVWIGVVLTLILISMIFCFCSCFLYHQFRMWKRNYRTTVTQSNDVESVKFNLDMDDPVPEYTLVSGLPSYEAALELLHKTPKSCLIVHPSVFEVFNKNEKSNSENIILENNSVENTTPSEATMPLLSDSSSNVNNKSCLPSYTEATTPTATITPTTPSLPYNHSLSSILSLASYKSQSKPKSQPSTPSSLDIDKQFKS